MHVHIAYLIGCEVAVDRGIDDGMVEVEHFLLGFLVPATRIRLIRGVKLGIRVQGGEKAALVIRGASHPTVSHACPLSNDITSTNQVLRASRGAEEHVDEACATSNCLACEH